MKHIKLYEEEQEQLIDILDGRDFYELCQRYRHIPMSNQKWTVEAFEDLKKFIRDNFIPKDEEIIRKWIMEQDTKKYNL